MINLSKVKLTPAQVVMLHTGESLVLSLVSSLLIGIIQYVSTNGINWPQLGSVAGTIFLGSMLMTYKSFQANPNFAPALFDTLDEIKNLVEQQQTPTIAPPPPMNFTIHTTSPATPAEPVSPPTSPPALSDVVNTAILPTVATSATNDPYKSPEQVQQVPFPAQQLANSFAFGVPTPAVSPQISLSSTGTATEQDTMPRSAKGK